MSTDIFKILRCKSCSFQRYHPDPQPDPGACPKCTGPLKYSDDWYIRVYVDGRRKLRAVGRNRRQADQILNKIRSDIVTNKFAADEPDVPLLSSAIDSVYHSRWKKTSNGDRAKLNASAWIELLGDVPVNAITPASYLTAIRAMEKTRSHSTINRYRAALRTVLRTHKVDYSFIAMDAEPEGRIKIISHQEEEAIIQHLRDTSTRRWPRRQAYRDEAAEAVIVLVDTGMRAGELLQNIRPGDVDLQSNLITVWENKAKKPRSVPMTERVKAILAPRVGEGRLFDLDIYQLDRAWDHARALMGQLDDPHFVVHSLRHTCATRLLQAGVDVYTVKHWLGHKSIKTTMRYLHLQPEMLSGALRAMESHRQQIVNADANNMKNKETQMT